MLRTLAYIPKRIVKSFSESVQKQNINIDTKVFNSQIFHCNVQESCYSQIPIQSRCQVFKSREADNNRLYIYHLSPLAQIKAVVQSNDLFLPIQRAFLKLQTPQEGEGTVLLHLRVSYYNNFFTHFYTSFNTKKKVVHISVVQTQFRIS